MQDILNILYTYSLFGAFLLGCVVAFVFKGYLDEYIENAAYAKQMVHPEMLDDNGKIDLETELLYLRTQDIDVTLDEDED
tara:strand:+ start:467 stop:706 length:240 start_codon:yes stop_codon:yes gene_type:complete